jgi:muramoyltetrapeptide carboxypeptidase
MKTSHGPSLIKPARLRPGDVVGLLAPAGHTDEEGIARAIANVEALGMRAKLSRNLRAIHGNYAGSVEQRLDDLHTMFADPEVKALWAVRGGSGGMALLPGIDYQLIRSHPKILLGYSDITALHLAIHRHAGLVTFHGPVASSTLSEYAERHLRAVLMAPQPSYTIPMAQENRDRARELPQFAARTVRAGQSTGRLIGGNLCLVTALVGTPYEADFHNSILFLEEIREVPYRIDRMMAQLQMSQGFEHAAALMLGVFEDCEAKDSEPSLTLAETLDQHLSRLDRPAVTGYSFGHIRDQFTLPVGLMARLDTEQQTLTLLEPAVL